MNSTLGILMTGYPYFLNKFRENETDVLETSLLFKKTISIKGEKAAKIFYDTDKFQRKGATPSRFKKTLFGKDGVQGLDEQAHRHRKKMFMQVMNPDSITRLQNLFEGHWQVALEEWQKQPSVTLFPEVEKILTRASCEWVGVPLSESDVGLRTSQLSQMIDSSGAVGIRHYQGRKARKKAEKWIEDMIEMVRNERIQIPEGSIMHIFTHYKDLDGKLLDKHVVSVEILNLLRPIVAIARYIVFSAMALEDRPSYYKKLQENEGSLYRNFVQEVRRVYPFFPFVAATVKESFDWNGHHFPKGRRVILDLYATNHDENIWSDPDDFYPERFENWDGSPFNFVPQGGGDHHNNHRCAGEWITIQLTESALRFLVNGMDYKVPPQDLSIDMSRIPAIPESRFIMKKVRKT